jgi:hypothetical protein
MEGIVQTEQDIVDATVAFQNGATLVVNGEPDFNRKESVLETSVQVWEQLVSELREIGLTCLPPNAAPISDLPSRYPNAHGEFLAAFVSDRAATEDKLVSRGIASSINVHATLWQPTKDGMAIVHHYEFSNPFDVITVGTALLFDRGKGFGQRLCQCQLESCRKFFFEKKAATGRPARRYCKTQHMLKAHDLNAPGRMKKRRGKPRAKK